MIFFCEILWEIKKNKCPGSNQTGAGPHPGGPGSKIPPVDFQRLVESKFWQQVLATRHQDTLCWTIHYWLGVGNNDAGGTET